MLNRSLRRVLRRLLFQRLSSFARLVTKRRMLRDIAKPFVVEVISADEFAHPVLDVRDSPEAIVLDLEQPLIVIERRCLLDQLQRLDLRERLHDLIVCLVVGFKKHPDRAGGFIPGSFLDRHAGVNDSALVIR